MSADFFLDTNIFVYTFDRTAEAKRNIAQKLVQHAIATGAGRISCQVVQEFLNVATGKLRTGMIGTECMHFVDPVLEPMCRVHSHLPIALQSRYRFGFDDSLIVVGAIEADCARLYAEDLQNGQVIDSLTIINPFAEENAIHEPLEGHMPLPA